MKILALSDVVDNLVYSPQASKRFAGVDFILSCGDLPYYYLEYVISTLNKPMFFVRGNHSSVLEFSATGATSKPQGAENLHRKVKVYENLTLAGIEGSLKYREGPFQYSQSEMWAQVFSLIPGLMWNKARFGRYLDIFVSHAPPWGIHDQPDLPHQGIKSFRWLLRVFKPTFHFHGHIHVYKPGIVIRTHFFKTEVINSYGYIEAEMATGKTGSVDQEVTIGNHSDFRAGIIEKTTLSDREESAEV